MTLVDRFLKYVSFDTQSDESTGLTPSTSKQMVFAEYLKKELESLGLEDITLDEHGYLFATLPANIDKEVPTIGFIAHMDTSHLFKKLDDTDIWEFRTFYNKTKYRLLAFWDKDDKINTLVIATHGFIKKTQKTPLKEIAKAEEIRKDYFNSKR